MEQSRIDPHELVKLFEKQIKETVIKRFSISFNSLELLSKDKNGAYLSQEDPDTLCCFVVGKDSGFLYLVTGEINEDKKKLINLKSDIIS